MLLIWGLQHTRYMLHQWAKTSLSQGSFSVSESQFPFSFQKYLMLNLKHSDFQNTCKATFIHSQTHLPNTQQNNVQISTCDMVVCKREIVQCNFIFVRPPGTLLGKVLHIQCPSLTQCMGPLFTHLRLQFIFKAMMPDFSFLHYESFPVKVLPPGN